jgi:microcystin-dependent protein
MGTPFVGEIRLFAGNFAPQGWAFCDGSLMAIADNDTLFSLIGTTYGGDGTNTFGLPDLRGRVPVHQGTGAGTSVTIGENGGTESVTLTTQQMPTHQHAFQASNAVGGASSPASNVFAQGPPGGVQVYTQDNSVIPSGTPVSADGGGQPHENRQPLLAVSFIISLFGIFPSQS